MPIVGVAGRSIAMNVIITNHKLVKLSPLYSFIYTCSQLYSQLARAVYNTDAIACRVHVKWRHQE